MERRTVDGRGLQCPRPVIHTKRVIKDMTTGVVEVTVDNEIAVQNLAKMAVQMGLSWSSQVISDAEYVVEIRVGETNPESEQSSDPPTRDVDQSQAVVAATTNRTPSGPVVVVLASDRMGEGDDELGKTLMKAFVYALTEADTVPDQILLYNGGVRLAVEDSDAVQDLVTLRDRGVDVMSCGACLSFYELTDRLAVGTVTNMYAIVETLLAASKVIRP